MIQKFPVCKHKQKRAKHYRDTHSLNYTHILKRLYATSGIECILMCVNEDGCCRSVNYKKNSLNDEKENCELLHVTPAEEPGLLEVHIDYAHYVLLQPKRVSECYTCIYGITCPEIYYPMAHAVMCL
jgi:hypothetical protein